jgi:2-keto-3-deoxy-L-rhamnonate aldolase RhmA
MIGFIIEEITAVNNLDEILDTKSLDFIDLGPLDLAHSMDWPEQEEVDGFVNKIVDGSISAGKIANSGGSAENLSVLLDRGFRMITVNPRSFFENGGVQFLAHAAELMKAKGLS